MGLQATFNKPIVKLICSIFMMIVGVVMIVSSIVWFALKIEEKQQLLQKTEQAKLEMKWMAETPVSEYERFDPWGTKYRMESEDSPEMVVRTQIVTSAGPDQLFGTNDDMQVLERDLNWTHAGEAAGARAGRVARGFIKGLGKSNDGN